jgi:23S rRNA (pseudouridine1915-N3)-methyltransferase
MAFKLYFFGKKGEINTREKELLRRINFRTHLELIPLSQAGIKDEERAKAKEAEKFLAKIRPTDFLIAFHETGQDFNSLQFANWLNKKQQIESSLVAVVGGAHGLDRQILTRANIKLSFSKMVWTRNLFRLMALEQIYRAVEIQGGSNFHKI